MIKDEVIQLVLEFTYKYISPKEADRILSIFKRQIEEMKNPYEEDSALASGWNACQNMALRKLLARQNDTAE